ncbi:hypothetical protein J3R82DRAFT_8602 [Butyriboletus roseoflavus]|nr:hypothetical protein J3R82DRAFT_8602 [Butyriboletus roseoflavus]
MFRSVLTCTSKRHIEKQILPYEHTIRHGKFSLGLNLQMMCYWITSGPSGATQTCSHFIKLLRRHPENSTERAYQDALHESYLQEDHLKTEVVSMQAATVLNGMYCDWLHGQLAAQAEKEQAMKKRKGKLMGDGLFKYLTGDAFYQWVVDHEKAVKDVELAKKECQMKKDACTEARVAWKDVEKGRLERNRVQQ